MSRQEAHGFVLELVRGEEAGEAFAFRPGVRQYLLRREDGTYQAAPLAWTPSLLEDLSALDQPHPERAVVQRLGEELRAFLDRLGWQREEARLLEALHQGRALQLTFRFAAAELYALPWELVTLRQTGQHLGELSGCLLRYEWPGTTTPPARPEPPAPGGRLLFAWSAAGGAVPAADQLQHVRQACERAGLPFEEQRDVVAHVSRERLAEALALPGPPVVILHLLCHGSSSASGDTSGVLWEGPRGGADLVDGGSLRQLLAPHLGTLRLVVLSACRSGGAASPGNPLGSLAQALHRMGVMAVVASRLPLSVRGSVKLVETLYGRLLGDPCSLEQAVDVARERLVRTASQLDWAALQLYTRVADGGDTRPVVFQPYRGLLAFRPEDNRFFFGREVLAGELLRRVHEALEERVPRFQLVVGASGSGKSSLVLAGLLPRLPSQVWDIAVLRPGEGGPRPQGDTAPDASPGPLPTLALLWRRLRAPWSLPQTPPPVLDGRALLMEAERMREARPGRRLLLVVDQLEELFTQVPEPAERQAFLRALWELSRASELGVVVVSTLRVDFLGRCGELVLDEQGQRLDAVAYAEAHRLFVGQLQAEHLSAVIEGPAQRVGLSFEQGLVEVLRRDVEEEPGALPLLEYALDLLWERREGSRLTHRAYDDISGVAGALTQAADALHDALGPEEQRQARRLLVEMVELRGEAGRYTRRRAWVKALRPEEPRAREAFEKALGELLASRLLVYEGRPEAGCVQVAHEALLHRWERLRQWVQEDREALLQVRELQTWARDWSLHEKDVDGGGSYLLTGSRLGYAQEVRRKRGADMDGELHRFITTSQQRESQQQRRARRRRLALVSAAMVTAMLMGVLALRAQWARREADAWARRARASAALSAARAEFEADPTQSLLFLREMADGGEQVDPEWMTSAVHTLQQPLSTAILRVPGSGITWVDFSPDGQWVATASREGSARVWRADGRGQPLVLAGHGAALTQVVFSPDGQRLLTASADGTARVWRLQEPGSSLRLEGHRGPVTCAVFDPTGTRVATGSADGTARVWRLDASGPPVVLQGHTGPVNTVAFNRMGTRVLTASADGTARVWSADGQGTPVVLAGHTQAVTFASFDPAGTHVATASADHTARVWSADGQGAPVVLAGHQGGLTTAVFSGDGRKVLTASFDLTARVWPVDGKAPPVLLEGHLAVIRGGAFSPDDRHVLTFAADATARVWSVDSPLTPLVLRGHRFGVSWATFDPRGTQVLTGSSDGSARVWALDFEQGSHSFSGHQDAIWAVNISPDGTLLASASHDKTVRIWSQSQPPVVLRGFTQPVRSVVFSADSRRVLTADFGGVVQEQPVEGGQPPRVLIRLKEKNWAFWAIYGPGERWVAVSSADGIVRLVAADGSGRVLRQFVGHTGRVRTVDLSPDGTRLATASEDGTVRIWNIEGSGEPLVLTDEQGGWMRSALFSPEGRRLLTSGQGMVRVWSLENPPRPLFTAEHATEVRWAAWSPDGRHFATASADRLVRIWSADGSTPPMLLSGHTDVVTSAVFSPDGSQLITASADRTVRQWKQVGLRSVEQFRERVRSATSACLLPEQRQRLLGESALEAGAAHAACERRYGR